MRKIILLTLYGIFPLAAFAQECGNYMYLHNNSDFIFTEYNKKGEEGLTVNYLVSSVKQIPDGSSSQILSILRDKKGKIMDSATGNYKCENGKLYVDMRASMPSSNPEQFKGMQVEANESYLEYPSGMSSGESLPDGAFHMDLFNNGHPFASVDYNVTDRKVEDQENVTTPAGSWNCFRITSNALLRMKIGIGIPMRFKVVEWFAPGFGIVKTEDFNKNDKLAGTMVLTSISK